MVLVYSMPHCPQCDATVKILEENNIQFTKIDMSVDDDALEKVRSMGYRAAPVVVADDSEHWSGFRPDKIKNLKTA